MMQLQKRPSAEHEHDNTSHSNTYEISREPVIKRTGLMFNGMIHPTMLDFIVSKCPVSNTVHPMSNKDWLAYWVVESMVPIRQAIV